jgi:phenylalanyl-tRNA synthetase alpha chain
MSIEFTVTQKERLTDLGAPAEIIAGGAVNGRDAEYRALETEYVAKNKTELARLLDSAGETESMRIISELSAWLSREEYARVETPTVIPLTMLDKMTVTEDEPLRDQIYRVDKNKCLRPMLAPGLYILMRELHRITGKPVRIFEAGSCFRRESEGGRHLSEFTMLNMVEFAGTEDGAQTEKLRKLAAGAMEAVGIEDYTLETESSIVYGETIDIVSSEGLELASASYGPHSLDPNWGVFEPWVGIGFGIERLALARNGGGNIKRFSRSVNFLGGMSLRV